MGIGVPHHYSPIIMYKFISVLSFEDLGIYNNNKPQDEQIDCIITWSILSLEFCILFICLFQLWRFFSVDKLYIKKVIHILIALQIIGMCRTCIL